MNYSLKAQDIKNRNTAIKKNAEKLIRPIGRDRN